MSANPLAATVARLRALHADYETLRLRWDRGAAVYRAQLETHAPALLAAAARYAQITEMRERIEAELATWDDPDRGAYCGACHADNGQPHAADCTIMLLRDLLALLPAGERTETDNGRT